MRIPSGHQAAPPSEFGIQVFHQPAGWTFVRTSRYPEGPYLEFSFGDWSAFVRSVKDTNLCAHSAVAVECHSDGVVLMSDRNRPHRPALVLNSREWDDFIGDVANGRHDRDDLEPRSGDDVTPSSSTAKNMVSA